MSPTPRSISTDARSSTHLIGDVVESGATVVVSAHDALRTERLNPRTLTMAGGLVLGSEP